MARGRARLPYEIPLEGLSHQRREHQQQRAGNPVIVHSNCIFSGIQGVKENMNILVLQAFEVPG